MTTNERSLPRSLGLWSAVAVVIGTTIGSGIFRSPASIAGHVPDPTILMFVWILGGVVALCGALSLAEVATALPHTGGLYVFIRDAWGRLPAFLFGWTELVIIRAAAIGAVATTCAEYTIRTFGYDTRVAPYDSYVHYAAAVFIAALAAVNIVGVRWASGVLNFSAVAKYTALLFIIGIAFAIPSHPAAPAVVPSASSAITVGAFGLALVSVLWSYDGWADLSFIAGEVKEPRRTLPRAFIGGTVAVIAIYLAANIAYLKVLPIDQMRTSKLIAADVAQLLLGTWGVTFVGVVVVVSTFGTLNGSLLTAPRIFFAMADDGLLFRQFAAVHPRFKTPYVSIMLCAVLGIAFVLLRTFEQLADTFVTAILPFYGLAVASVFSLRRRPGYDPSYRAPGFPIVPSVFILSTVYLVLNGLIEPASRWPTAAVFATVLFGIPVYYLTVRRRGDRV
ncbi:MAG: putative permease [Gemmatimonadetes bacterium]|nr:putative permease [Gemmatimonadota bacterium]